MDAAELLPLAFVMIAGPQIVAAVLLAARPRWKAVSAGYVIGGAAAVTAFYTAFYFIARQAAGASGTRHTTASRVLDIIILVILAVLAVLVFLGRRRSAKPRWMTKVQSGTPRFAFVLGLLMLGVFPTDIATTATVGARLASQRLPWADAVPFIALTIVLLALPAILVLTLGTRAQRRLPAVRHWMDTNSWIISEVVLAFFIASTVQKLLAGLSRSSPG